MSTIRSMNRLERRAAAAYAREQSRKWPGYLVSIPREEWPSQPPKVFGVMRSRNFLVQKYEEDGCTRLSINRVSILGDGNWSADISWEELQRLKSEAGYGDFDAVEVFPPDRDVVNVANMRHLWVLPHPLPFAWRSK